MIEVSLWGIVVIVEIFVVVVAATALLLFLARGKRKRLEAKIAKLKQELSEHTEPPASLDAPVEEGSTAGLSGPPQLVLLTAEDVDAATWVGQPKVPLAGDGDAKASGEDAEASGEDAEASGEDAEASGEDAETSGEDAAASREEAESGDPWQALLDRNQALNDGLNAMLERSAELAMKIGGLRGSEEVSDGVKEQLQALIDQLRESDEVLVNASDIGMELDERIRQLQTTPPVGEGNEKSVDHVSLNEILMARADGQTEEELAVLRDEVRRRLLAPPVEDTSSETVAELAAAEERLAELSEQLDQEHSERTALQESLSEVTDEYQRLFEQFQPSA